MQQDGHKNFQNWLRHILDNETLSWQPPKIHKSENMPIWDTPNLFLKVRFLHFFFIPVVQQYLNEISPTIYGPNKPKTSGKPLRIPDLQTPALYHDKPATL